MAKSNTLNSLSLHNKTVKTKSDINFATYRAIV